MNTADQSPLGKTSAYQTTYAPELLFPIARQQKRDELNLSGTLPFFGVDIWNAYELSWLNLRGKPQVAIATVIAPADTPNIIESKSFKLYLNSFNQTRLADSDALLALLNKDLAAGFGAPVRITLTPQEHFGQLAMGELDGVLLDRLDVEIDQYSPAPQLLRTVHGEKPVEETLVSHLLKSNCLVTGQPDWASVQIHYVGQQIEQEGLLKYLIAFASTMNSMSNASNASSWTSRASARHRSWPSMPATRGAAASTSIPGAAISAARRPGTCVRPGNRRLTKVKDRDRHAANRLHQLPYGNTVDGVVLHKNNTI
jgi:7-cyano-7-deazaguanine reductase